MTAKLFMEAARMSDDGQEAIRVVNESKEDLELWLAPSVNVYKAHDPKRKILHLAPGASVFLVSDSKQP